MSVPKLVTVPAVLVLLFVAGIPLGDAAAQTYVTPLPPANYAWGDPYQTGGGNAQVMYQPGSLTSGVLESFGQLFTNPVGPTSQVVAVQNPYASSPPLTQLNPPIVDGPVILPDPITGAPVVQTAPSYQRYNGIGGFFPRMRNRLDSRLYWRTEYLAWDLTGMNAPPLVTGGPNTANPDDAGVLGENGTAVLFGGDKLNGGESNGWMMQIGFWSSPAQTVAIEGEYFKINDQNDGFQAASDGSTVLARPYFDIVGGGEASELIAYPGLSSGRISVSTENELRSFLLNGRFAICPANGPCCPDCGLRDRTDLIIGYRHLRLKDSIAIGESHQFGSQNPIQSVNVADSFQTENDFHGLQLGFVNRALLRKTWLESTFRIAMGNMDQSVQVAGGTTQSGAGGSSDYNGGLLAQRTNSGTQSREEFVLIPELGIRWGFKLTRCFHASIGYTVLYLPNVVRASEQIDRDINPGLIPVEDNPLTGALRPRVMWVQNDYVAHGIQLGGVLMF